MNGQPSKTVKSVIYCLLATLILSLGFYSNFWHVADEEWFLYQNYDMESFVVGRLVESDTNGVYSYGGLTGVGATGSQSGTTYQYTAFLNRLPFDAFETYNSQIGGQGILFSLLDRQVDHYFYPSTQFKLNLYHGITSLFSALTISLIVLWFYWEFGFLASIFVFASALFSPWLTVFGGKLWWAMGAFYFPMVAIQFYLHNKTPNRFRYLPFGILVFLSVLIKCVFNGYEYITTALVMMMVPFVYYSIKWRSGLKRVVGGFTTAVASSILAVVVSFALLCLQISSVTGSYSTGIEHIVSSFNERTYAGSQKVDTQFSPSLESNPLDVVMTYINGNVLGTTHYYQPSSNQWVSLDIPKLSYSWLILLFLAASVLLFFFRKKQKDDLQIKNSLSLIATTWFAFLAPLSWFVIFKAHSYVHTHMNFIVWQMPFTLFGFAVCGLLLQTLLTRSKLPAHHQVFK